MHKCKHMSVSQVSHQRIKKDKQVINGHRNSQRAYVWKGDLRVMNDLKNQDTIILLSYVPIFLQDYLWVLTIVFMTRKKSHINQQQHNLIFRRFLKSCFVNSLRLFPSHRVFKTPKPCRFKIWMAEAI